MATIRTSIQLTDGMSPVFRSINKTMNIVISSFESLQRVSGEAINISSIETARRELYNVSSSFEEIQNHIRNADNQQQKFKTSLRDGSNQASQLDGVFRKVVTKLASGDGFKKIIDLSDTLAQTKSRLDLINDGSHTTAQLQDKIFQSAERSRGSFQDTADVISKLGLLAGNAFSGNDEIIRFSELMQKTFNISGVSASESADAMSQLTQAMASGRLQGDEFQSIAQNAPMLATAIAEYTGVGIQGLYDLASEGGISAEIIKNSLFSIADEIEAKHAALPMTIGQIWNSIKNNALQIFDPILTRINELANAEEFEYFKLSVINVMRTVGQIITNIFDLIVNVSSFLYDNWSAIEPIVWGVVGAFAAYKTILLIIAVVQGAAAVAQGIYNVACFIGAIASGNMTAAQSALNVAMKANPIVLIASLIIGILLVAISKWVKSVGGLRIAWLICMDQIQFAFDNIVIGINWGIYGILSAFDLLKLGARYVWVALADFFGSAKVDVLTTLQDMANGAIDIINDLINAMNKLPYVHIDPIKQLTFGTNAAVAEEAARQSRHNDLEAYETDILSKAQSREDEIQKMTDKANKAHNDRLDKIEEAKKKASDSDNTTNKKPDYQPQESTEYASNTADNTKKIADSVSATEEELMYLRDIAEREVINRFTTAEVKLELGGIINNVNQNTDLDGVMTYLEDRLTETLVATADGSYSIAYA